MRLNVNIAVSAMAVLLFAACLETSAKVVESGVSYLPVNNNEDHIAYVLSPSGVVPDDMDTPSYYILTKDQMDMLYPTDLEKVAFIRGSDPGINCIQIIQNDIRVPEFIEADGEFVPVLGLYPGVFKDAKSKHVWLPDCIRYILNDAFQNANNIKEIELPASLSVIEENAFNNMATLEKVVVRGRDGKINADPTAFAGSAEHAVLYVDSASGVVDLTVAPWNRFKEVRPLGDFYGSANQKDILTYLSNKDSNIIEHIDFPTDLDHREIRTYADLKEYRPGVFAPETPSFFQFWMKESAAPVYWYPTYNKSFPISANGVEIESQELFFIDNLTGEETFKYHVCEVYRTEDGKTTTFGPNAEMPGLAVKENAAGNQTFEFATNESGNSVSWVVCLKSDMKVDHVDSTNPTRVVNDYKYILMPFYQLGAGEMFSKDVLRENVATPEDCEYTRFLQRLADAFKP